MRKSGYTFVAALVIYLAAMMASTALADSIRVPVVDVYDIDTFYVDLSGVIPVLGERLPIRVRGIDGAEIRGECDFEKDLAQQGKTFAQNTLFKPLLVELHNLERGKYFRVVADVIVGNQSYAELAIQSGLARRYDGGSRLPWCKENH